VDVAGWDAVSADQFWVVPNTSSVGNLSRGNSFHVSDGWKTVTSYLVADYDADGKTDLLGLNGNDQLFAWRSTATGGVPSFAPYSYLGNQWSTFGHMPTKQ
ncbi:hypothetical protein ACIBF6_37745, partial [Streptosporangium amethystogenes]|uniref:hypothetical protein n=1 Tax=Streptosporangium amethystogenes TaxID=2002 RepID=UPI00378D2C21